MIQNVNKIKKHYLHVLIQTLKKKKVVEKWSELLLGLKTLGNQNKLLILGYFFYILTNFFFFKPNLLNNHPEILEPHC